MNRLGTLSTVMFGLWLATLFFTGCNSGEQSSAPETAKNIQEHDPVDSTASAPPIDIANNPPGHSAETGASEQPFSGPPIVAPESPSGGDARSPELSGVPEPNGRHQTTPLPKFHKLQVQQPPARPQSRSGSISSARPLPQRPAEDSAVPSPQYAKTETPDPIQPPEATVDAAPLSGRLGKLPAGTTRSDKDGFATVQVFYATDRQRMSDSDATLNIGLAALAVFLLPVSLILFWMRKRKLGISLGVAACGIMVVANLQQNQLSDITTNVGYNSQRGDLVRGICTVTVPDSHERGVVERPSLLRFELKEDKQKHLVLTSANELGEADYYDRLRETVDRSPDSDLLVFIHGFNVDFNSAVRRTAQIAVDLPFRGVPICYSWPSQGSLLSYSVDENNATWTVYHLRQFLLELCEKSGAKSINVVAHSMGNRAMTAALSQISSEARPEQLPLFDRIVLAAPDIDADRFRRELAPRLAAVGRNVTLYASSDDQALVVSKQLHGGYPRAGESGDGLVVIPGIETIDVSGIDLSLLGHSYYGNSESILRDLFGVVRDRMAAGQRQTLTERRKANLPYWVLR